MKYTNKYNLPASLADIIYKSTYDITQSDPYRIGVTTLINPPLPRLLSIKHWDKLEEDVSDHIWRITGNAYHYILAKTSEEIGLKEEKMEEFIEGMTLVAKPDIYCWDNESVEDYKITSVWTIKFGGTDSWEKQLNCYSWMLRKKGLPVSKLFVNAILRDWRKSEKRKYDDYPSIPFQRVEIKLWTDEEQEKFIRDRIKIYKEQINMELEKVPVCSPEDRWKKEDSYAVYKNQNKTASRVLENELSAKKWAKANIKAGDTSRIEKREGVDFKCQEFCLVNKFCSYYKEKYLENKKKKV